MDIIVGGPLKPNGQNVPTRVGEIVTNIAALAGIPNPRIGMEVWVASEKKAVRILTLKEATIAGVVVPNAVVDTWEYVPDRAVTTNLANKISAEEQRATLAEGALRDKVADLEENYIAHISEFNTEVEILHSEDANLQSNINEIQLDLQSKINELGQEYLKGIEDVNRGITRIDAKAIQIGSFEVESLTDGVGINFSNIDGTQSDSFEIPVATTESAGVMSAADKTKLNNDIPYPQEAGTMVTSADKKYAYRGSRDTDIVSGAYWVRFAASIDLRLKKWGSTDVGIQNLPAATTESAGVMSAEDKKNLTNILERLTALEDRVAVLEEYHKGVTATIAGNDLALENKITVNDVDLEITGSNAEIVDGNLIIN